MEITPLGYTVSSVGRHFKATKKKHSWRFSIQGQEHFLDVYASAISGKKRVFVNGNKLFDGKSPPGKFFQYIHSIEGVLVRVEQTEEKWDLMLDEVSFRDSLGGKKTWMNLGNASFSQWEGYKEAPVLASQELEEDKGVTRLEKYRNRSVPRPKRPQFATPESEPSPSDLPMRSSFRPAPASKDPFSQFREVPERLSTQPPSVSLPFPSYQPSAPIPAATRPRLRLRPGKAEFPRFYQ